MPAFLCGLHHPTPTPLDMPLGHWPHAHVFLRLEVIECAGCAQNREMMQ